MKKSHNTRGKQVGVSYTPAEMTQLQALRERSTCRSLSEYIRKQTLEMPLHFRWRNASFDGFVEEIVLLRRTMEEILLRPEWTPEEKEKLIGLQSAVKAVINKIVDVCSPT